MSVRTGRNSSKETRLVVVVRVSDYCRLPAPLIDLYAIAESVDEIADAVGMCDGIALVIDAFDIIRHGTSGVRQLTADLVRGGVAHAIGLVFAEMLGRRTRNVVIASSYGHGVDDSALPFSSSAILERMQPGGVVVVVPSIADELYQPGISAAELAVSTDSILVFAIRAPLGLEPAEGFRRRSELSPAFLAEMATRLSIPASALVTAFEHGVPTRVLAASEFRLADVLGMDASRALFYSSGA